MTDNICYIIVHFAEETNTLQCAMPLSGRYITLQKNVQNENILISELIYRGKQQKKRFFKIAWFSHYQLNILAKNV